MDTTSNRRRRPAMLVAFVSLTILAIAVAEAGAAAGPRRPAGPGPRPGPTGARTSVTAAAALARKARAEAGRERAVWRARLRTSRRRAVGQTADRSPPATPGVARSSSRVADWDAIASCESRGDWAINTGSLWGGLQFTPRTWFSSGGGPFNGVGAFPYSRAEQIAVAEKVLAVQGPGAWPHCFRWA